MICFRTALKMIGMLGQCKVDEGTQCEDGDRDTDH